MWRSAWNKRKLTSEIFSRFLPSTVSRALDWWSGGFEFKPQWGFVLCTFRSVRNASDFLIVRNPTVTGRMGCIPILPINTMFVALAVTQTVGVNAPLVLSLWTEINSRRRTLFSLRLSRQTCGGEGGGSGASVITLEHCALTHSSALLAHKNTTSTLRVNTARLGRKCC